MRTSLLRSRRAWFIHIFALLAAIAAGRSLGPQFGPAAGVSPSTVARGGKPEGGFAVRGAASAAGGGARSEDRLSQLRLADLARNAKPFRAGRDPWSFDDPPRRPVLAKSSPIVATPVAAVVPPTAAAPPASPPPPEPSLRYLGTFGPPEMKIAVFTDGKQWVHRLEGELLDPHFRVVRVGFAYADVERIDSPGAATVRMQAVRR